MAISKRSASRCALFCLFLLMTFFFREMPKLIDHGHLYLGMPPLFRITQGATTHYAMDDRHREELLKEHFTGRGKIDVSRFSKILVPREIRGDGPAERSVSIRRPDRRTF